MDARVWPLLIPQRSNGLPLQIVSQAHPTNNLRVRAVSKIAAIVKTAIAVTNSFAIYLAGVANILRLCKKGYVI